MTTIIIILYAIFSIVDSTTYLCSSYCNASGSCNGITPADCDSCGPIYTGSPCAIDTSTYTVLLEQAVTGSAGFNDTTAYTCGVYEVSGLYQNMQPADPDGVQISIYSSSSLLNHYDMRIIFFAFWLDATFMSSDTILVYVDWINEGSGSYDSNSTSTNICGNSGNEKGFRIDTDDFSHSNQTVEIILACNATSGGQWGFK